MYTCTRTAPAATSTRSAPWTLAAAAALTALALGAGAWLPAAAAADDAALHVDKLTMRVRGPRGDRAPSHRIDLRARFDATPSLDTFDPSVHDLRVTVGGLEVFTLPPTGARDGVRATKALQWRCRGRRRDGRPRVQLDLARLRFKLKSKGLDLPALADGDTTGVEVVLHLGDATFRDTLDLERSGQRLTLVPRGPGAGTPPRDDPPPGGSRDGPLALSTIDVGWYSSIQRPETAVARSAAEWSALWARHDGRTAAPRLDFTKEMVVAVFLGQRPDSAYSVAIDSATACGLRYAFARLGSPTG